VTPELSAGAVANRVRLYHFTALEYLPRILAEGLTRGDVPLGPTKRENAVWLTSNPEPTEQAWASEPHVSTDAERALHERLFGRPVPRGARYADKRAVVIAIEIPSGDPKLVRWYRYANRRGVNRRWMRTLEKVGGRGSDWWIFRGQIPNHRSRAA